jgi:hypothetical protein
MTTSMERTLPKTGLLLEAEWTSTRHHVTNLLGEGDLLGITEIHLVDVSRVKHDIGEGVFVGCILSVRNLDPPEDHPHGFDFTWCSALIIDFRDMNDELDLVSGVSGEELDTYVSWQPRVDKARTKLVAWVRPGSWERVEFRERGSATRLASKLAKRGYDAVILSGDNLSVHEVPILEDYAREMRRTAELQLCLATTSRVQSLFPWDSSYLRLGSTVLSNS